MKKLSVLAISISLAIFGASSTAFADSGSTPEISPSFESSPVVDSVTNTTPVLDLAKVIQTAFPMLAIQSVTPITGTSLSEIVANQNMVLYATNDGKYLVPGELIEVGSKRNLTKERADQLNKVDFASLPKELAIKFVNGTGEHELAVFSDPECPYCRKLEVELAKLQNVTIYLYPYPIPQLHPNAINIVNKILCDKDPAKAWRSMLTGKAPVPVTKKGAKVTPTCENNLQQIMALGNKLGINGTPTTFSKTGQRVPGAVPSSILQKIAEGTSPN